MQALHLDSGEESYSGKRLKLPRPLVELRRLDSLTIDMVAAAVNAGSLAELTTLRTLALLPARASTFVEEVLFDDSAAHALLALAASLPRLGRVEFGDSETSWWSKGPPRAAVGLMGRLPELGVEVVGDAIGAGESGDEGVEEGEYSDNSSDEGLSSGDRDWC